MKKITDTYNHIFGTEPSSTGYTMMDYVGFLYSLVKPNYRDEDDKDLNFIKAKPWFISKNIEPLVGDF